MVKWRQVAESVELGAGKRTVAVFLRKENESEKIFTEDQIEFIYQENKRLLAELLDLRKKIMPENNVDFRELLKKYIKHVGYEEGIDFLDHYMGEGLLIKKEYRLLKEISDEVWKADNL